MTRYTSCMPLTCESSLITSAEVAQHLRCSRKTVEALVHVGRLRPIRILGRKWLFDRDEVNATLEASRQPLSLSA